MAKKKTKAESKAAQTVTGKHVDLPYGSSLVTMFGVGSEDKTYYDGSNHQFKGKKRNAVFNIGVDKGSLDAPVKRVGFMGVNNDQPLQFDLPASAEYNNGLWDLDFELHKSIMGTNIQSNIRGSFFVETTNNTYYWLKDQGVRDFEFSWNSRLTLDNWYPSCN